MKRRVHVLTGGDMGLRIWGLGSGCGGFVISTEKGKKGLNWIEKMASICQGSQVDFCILKELMVLRNRERNINPLMSLLFFKLWPAEHKCIANQFNPVTTLRFHMMCGWQQCQAHSRVSVAWSPGQGKSPDLRGILTWQGHTSNGILTSGSETIEIFPSASYTLFNLLLIILSLFKWGFISFVFWFVFCDILLMDWVSPVSSGSQADKNVKTGVLAFKTQTHTSRLFALSHEMTQQWQMNE